MNRLAPAVILLALAVPAAAFATDRGVQVMKNWKSSDQCARDAQAAFPDFTAEATAKRDAKLKECLAGRNLPPRGLSARRQ